MTVICLPNPFCDSPQKQTKTATPKNMAKIIVMSSAPVNRSMN